MVKQIQLITLKPIIPIPSIVSVNKQAPSFIKKSTSKRTHETLSVDHNEETVASNALKSKASWAEDKQTFLNVSQDSTSLNQQKSRQIFVEIPSCQSSNWNNQKESKQILQKSMSSFPAQIQKSCISTACSSFGSHSKYAIQEESEVEIELPGGFDNIHSYDNSSDSESNSSQFIYFPKVEKWIENDWESVEISSDVEENRQMYKKFSKLTKNPDYQCEESHLKCMTCCKHFNSQMELNSHELDHQVDNPFKCHVHNCASKYKKQYQLMSHIKKRHSAYWNHLNQVFKQNHIDQSQEIQLMLNPNDEMLSFLKPKNQMCFNWFQN